ncbi:MAG: tetratricopeptide repeat protein [Pseudolabrys sp.]|jgi:TolB-like protein
MNQHSGGGLKKATLLAREHLSNAVIGGLFLMLTGFTPDHLVARALEILHLSPETLKSLFFGIDPRILLVLFGVAVIVGDQLLRRRAAQPHPVMGPSISPEAAQTAASASIPDRPSIAVLPFQNMSGDPEQEYFADGMVEEIITALSRMRWLFVIARNSCFIYKGRAVDVKQVGRELGVRYVLEGSVRKSGTRIRITGQLIDASTGSHIWADRIDGGVEDIFSLQDHVTASVVGAIAPKLEQAEIDRTKHKPTDSLDAYDYYLRGMASLYRGKKDAVDEAQALFRKATEIDPGFATAYGMAGYCYVWRKANGWVGDRSAETAEAVAFARKATDLGRDDAVALSEAGFVFAFVAGDLDQGAALIDRAMSLNPNLAAAWRFSGYTRVFLGQPEIAIEHLQQAIRLSPLDPLGFIVHNGMALAHFFSGRYEEAAAAAEKAGLNYIPGVLMRAVSLAMAGREEESKSSLARLRELDPTVTASKFEELWPLWRPDDRTRFAEGMRKLGMP